jgi:hypothetical protein
MILNTIVSYCSLCLGTVQLCVKKHVNITKYIFMPVFLLFLLLSFLLQEGTRNRCKLLEWMLT